MTECPVCESEDYSTIRRECPTCGHYDEQHRKDLHRDVRRMHRRRRRR